jgi:hypothetical protein
MFKTKEELIKGRFPKVPYSVDDETEIGMYAYYQYGLDDAFQSVSERVIFYEKYRITKGQDNPGFLLFREEQPELYKKYNEERMMQPFRKLHYNNWLYHYCFDGVK